MPVKLWVVNGGKGLSGEQMADLGTLRNHLVAEHMCPYVFSRFDIEEGVVVS